MNEAANGGITLSNNEGYKNTVTTTGDTYHAITNNEDAMADISTFGAAVSAPIIIVKNDTASRTSKSPNSSTALFLNTHPC